MGHAASKSSRNAGKTKPCQLQTQNVTCVEGCLQTRTKKQRIFQLPSADKPQNTHLVTRTLFISNISQAKSHPSTAFQCCNQCPTLPALMAKPHNHHHRNMFQPLSPNTLTAIIFVPRSPSRQHQFASTFSDARAAMQRVQVRMWYPEHPACPHHRS
mmetsp:Transcript_58764/g.94982  ORF Transcript_58764/g.94982 Transcript_58764/m.94982 type:complete len:157 (-) Transcript_58764:185-655(-)